MPFAKTLLLALASVALAQDPNFDAINKPGLNEKVPAGAVYSVRWTVPAGAPEGPVSITLLAGPEPNLLEPVEDIAKSVDNSDGAFDWAVNSTLGDKATYGLRIYLDADPATFQYSTPFSIVGGGPSDSSDASTSASVSVSITASESSTTTSSSPESTGTASSVHSTTTNTSSSFSAPVRPSPSTLATPTPSTTVATPSSSAPAASSTASAPAPNQTSGGRTLTAGMGGAVALFAAMLA